MSVCLVCPLFSFCAIKRIFFVLSETTIAGFWRPTGRLYDKRRWIAPFLIAVASGGNSKFEKKRGLHHIRLLLPAAAIQNWKKAVFTIKKGWIAPFSIRSSDRQMFVLCLFFFLLLPRIKRIKKKKKSMFIFITAKE